MMPSLQEIEKTIKDLDIAKTIYAQMVQKDMIVTLHLPPFNKRLTLRSILKVAYDSQSDSSSDSSSSGDSPPAHSLPFWSQVFSEEGHLRLDRILPQLPAPRPMSRKETNIYIQSVKCSVKALEYYNAHNVGDEYEYVAPLISGAFMTREGCIVTHSNFLAKRKDSCNPELFFAVVNFSALYDEDPNAVIECWLLNPQYRLLSDEIPISAPRDIFHPLEHGRCPQCYIPGLTSDNERSLDD